MSLFDNLVLAIGHDWKWWLLPTRPVLSINYYERMYTIKEIKKTRHYEEEEYDEDRKLFRTEFVMSWREKKISAGVCLVFLASWVFYFRYLFQGHFNGSQPMKWPGVLWESG